MAAASPRHTRCAICMEPFTSPRLLGCFHTFCLECLRQLIQTRPRGSKSFPCPTCRSDISIPAGGAKKFQVNFYIEADMESRGKVHALCATCCKVIATHKCVECEQLFCDGCTGIHGMIAVAKSHTVISLKGATKVIRERYCDTHTDEKIRFYCEKCCQVVCRDCKLTSHEGHTTTDLCKKSAKAKSLIIRAINTANKQLKPKLTRTVEEARMHREKVQKEKMTMTKTLERKGKELKQEIDDAVARAKRHLEKKTKDVDQKVSKCLNSMSQEQACFESLMDYAMEVVNRGCDADILDMPFHLSRFFGQGHNSQGYATNTYGRSRGYTVCSPTSMGKLKLNSFMTDEWRTHVCLTTDEGGVQQSKPYGNNSFVQGNPKQRNPAQDEPVPQSLQTDIAKFIGDPVISRSLQQASRGSWQQGRKYFYGGANCQQSYYTNSIQEDDPNSIAEEVEDVLEILSKWQKM